MSSKENDGVWALVVVVVVDEGNLKIQWEGEVILEATWVEEGRTICTEMTADSSGEKI